MLVSEGYQVWLGVRAAGTGDHFGVGGKLDIVRLSGHKRGLGCKLLLDVRSGVVLRGFQAIALEGSVWWRLDTGEVDWR